MNKTNAVKHLAVCLLFAVLSLSSMGQGTAFTYQGRLSNDNSPANGSYDFTFALFATNSGGTALAGPFTNAGIGVSNGLFTAIVDFGEAFAGASNWLEIAVRTNGAGAFTTLSPRNQLTPVPYAISAESLSGGIEASQLAGGTVPTNVIAGFQGPLYGTIGGGQSNTANNSDAVVGGGSGNTASGQQSTVPGGHNNLASGNFSFAAGDMAQATNLGAFVWSDAEGSPFRSTNNNSFNVRASGGVFFDTSGAGMSLDGAPVLTIASAPLGITLQQNAGGGPNVIEGSQANYAAPGVIGAVIGGGGATNYHGVRFSNSVADVFTTIGGGMANEIQTRSPWSVIGGGQNNIIFGDGLISGSSVIGGGNGNEIFFNADYSTIGGGVGNYILGDSHDSGSSVIVGGTDNIIASNAPFSFIGGGQDNQIVGDGNALGGSVVQGGNDNEIYSNSENSVIGGGAYNSVASASPYSFVGGGYGNQAGGGGYATVPGGVDNLALGYASFAAGQGAQTTQNGTFVWADTEGGVFSATGPNQFLIRAGGGVGIGTTAPQASVDIVSGNGLGDPQLRLVQQNGTDYSRLRFQTGTMPYWDVAAGGPADIMNWYLPNYGNVMSLATNGMLTTGGLATGGLTTGGLTVNNDGALHVSGAGQNTKTAAFVQVATAGNTSAYATDINNPLCNGNPSAILIVTPVFNGNAGNQNHSIAVGYGADISSATQWCIYNTDLDNMQIGCTFNVLVILP